MNKSLIVALFATTLLSTGCDPKFWKMEMWMWSENHKSMDFYGTIVDQNNRPVEGVSVTAGVGTYDGPTRSGGQKYFTVSDVEGRFSFTGIHGAGSGYLLEKSGYEFNQRQPFASRPKDYVPDPNKPAILSIWKLQGAEPMLRTQIQAGLACDGTPRRLDLLTGRRDTGNLVVALTRKPTNIDRGRPFDWTLTLEIPGGGLIETSDIYPYKAPSGGYESSISINMPANTKQWTPQVNRSYYIFDGKNYGRITIDIMANYQPPPTHFEVASYMNPMGSRNLEFDQAKQLHP